MALIFMLGGVFLFSEKLLRAPQDILPNIAKEIPKVVDVAKEIKREVLSPPPLRVKRVAAPISTLTRFGIINQTNLQRKANGSGALSENFKLNQAAALKVADMFSRQYFAHVSPTGDQASNLVEKAGYKYLSVGENLALGNFSDDKDLVRAWMNSPGHRANILEDGFQEIGVAADKGMFEGEETWLAVQIFARPESACPKPDEGLKLLIESSEKKAEELSKIAHILRVAIESEEPKTKKEAEEHNQKVGEYNDLVKSVNTLINEIKTLIFRYNSQVRTLNDCIAG